MTLAPLLPTVAAARATAEAAADAEAAAAAEADRVAAEKTAAESEEMMPLGGGTGVAGAASPGGGASGCFRCQAIDTLFASGFASLDKDGDGHLDASERKHISVIPGVSTILLYLDKDGDGRISMAELYAGASMAVAGLTMAHRVWRAASGRRR